MAVGKVKQIIGPTVDLEFPSDDLPNILNAIKIDDDSRDIHLTVGETTTLKLGDKTIPLPCPESPPEKE